MPTQYTVVLQSLLLDLSEGLSRSLQSTQENMCVALQKMKFFSSVDPFLWLILCYILGPDSWDGGLCPCEGLRTHHLLVDLRLWRWRESRHQWVFVMDELTIKTPNPKCRLHGCLVEFRDWRYSQSCWYFRPALWTIAPITFSLVSSPPLFCVNKYTVYQCSGSMTFWGGSGSSDPCFWLMDPDPAILVIGLQDASKKQIFNTIFSAYYFLKVHLHHFSKIKCQKESQNRRNQDFSYYFFMIIEGSGSIPLTSGSGSGRPKNMWIRIRNRNTDVYRCVYTYTVCKGGGGVIWGRRREASLRQIKHLPQSPFFR